mmetsp:Transcript_64297/g.158222  ORF Transcript_64297/g.158222 Transcript_64297/m.158222 type:complete len:727 (+) Transcript_64297:129-2309(+)
MSVDATRLDAARLDTSDLLRRFDKAIQEAEAASPRVSASPGYKQSLLAAERRRSPRPLPTTELLRRFDEAINISAKSLDDASPRRLSPDSYQRGAPMIPQPRSSQGLTADLEATADPYLSRHMPAAPGMSKTTPDSSPARQAGHALSALQKGLPGAYPLTHPGQPRPGSAALLGMQGGALLGGLQDGVPGLQIEDGVIASNSISTTLLASTTAAVAAPATAAASLVMSQGVAVQGTPLPAAVDELELEGVGSAPLTPAAVDAQPELETTQLGKISENEIVEDFDKEHEQTPVERLASRRTSEVSTGSSPISGARRLSSSGTPRAQPAMKLSSTLRMQMKGRSRLGHVVTRLSGSWTFVSALTQGIRAAVERLAENSNPEAVLNEEDFEETTKHQFVQGTGAAPFKFKDYSPAAFRQLRYLFGVDDESYLNSCGIQEGLSEISTADTGSKSGQKFLISRDGRYFMKTTTKSEARFFRRILPLYFRHMKDHRNSLLCRFFGLHRIKPGKGKMYLLVMGNIFDTDRIIHQRFDLKGSTVGRAVSEAEKTKPTVILKDLDFMDKNKNLDIGPERKSQLMGQISADCQFLQSIHVMDYSLLLGVHWRDKQPAAALKNKLPPPRMVGGKKIQAGQLLKTGSLMLQQPEKTHTSAFQQHDGGWCSQAKDPTGLSVTGNEIYFLGIIDYLQYYNSRKHAETLFKGIQHKRDTISAVPPRLYAARFQGFLDSIIR